MPLVERGVDGADRIVIVLRAPREWQTSAAHGPGSDAEWSDLQIAVAQLSGLHEYQY